MAVIKFYVNSHVCLRLSYVWMTHNLRKILYQLCMTTHLISSYTHTHKHIMHILDVN